MNRLLRQQIFAALPPHLLSLHPLPGSEEEQFPPPHAWVEERCRLCQSFDISLHFIGDGPSDSFMLIVDFGQVDGVVWQLHIHRELWLSAGLQRTFDGIAPLFEVHPLAWASQVHNRMLTKWGHEHGVLVTAVSGLSRHLFLRKLRKS